MSTSLNRVENALRNPAATYIESSPEPTPVPSWKEELNARLAAHRQRRPGAPLLDAGTTVPAGSTQHRGSTGHSEPPARASLVAARVAERYAKAPSYSELLAASAAAAAAAAETAAFAAMQAQEAAEAHARFAATEAIAAQAAIDAAETAEVGSPQQNLIAAEPNDRRAMVEHPEPLPARGILPPRHASASPASFFHGSGFVDAFAEALVPAAVSLPAKLIEFPRELIASRKSRPRIAEGPLAESLPPSLPPPMLSDQADGPSLRIFEVEGSGLASELGDAAGGMESHSSDALDSSYSAHSETAPARHVSRPAGKDAEHGASPWQSIRLGEHPVNTNADREQRQAISAGQPMPVLHTASLADRTMAALVDLAVVGCAFLLFVLAFAMSTAHPSLDKLALIGAALVFSALFLFYEWLFMSYGGGTLGMRYAQIALCTFEDENPTRQMLQKRVAASALCALPLGLGLLWALFDEDSLGWHDRITRSYQRSYR